MVETTTASDKNFMCDAYGCGYDWFETQITLNEYLDDENCTGTVASMSNVFQIQEEFDEGIDVKVITIEHSPSDMNVIVKDGFWIEDFPLLENEVKITFRQAWKRLNKANLPKPHSRKCVLRKEIGPRGCNPQYIFGNIHSQIYVDAVTGDVSDTNPAYKDIQE